ncbi:hypothetical protein [Williamsia sterculiae]|uniref:Cellulose synthase subunit n=1 Tax=Williamsia sterculiae TaxID=1344003 RepID=A0A1N7CU15_9NOCA|nr:hypothetical protein [Williamsia sterculiae]SIR67092.1 hypothetical protein SAMN05445060_0362 [Williamsia sterculiae]
MFLVCVVAFAMPTLVGAPVWAAPGDNPPPLSLNAIGSSSTITLPGQQSATSVLLPVPRGLTPRSIRAVTNLPAFVTGGTVDVAQGDRLLSRTALPTTAGAPVELPLSGAVVTDNAVDLTIRSSLRTEGPCPFDTDNEFRLNRAQILYSGGDAAPAVVADFLPPVLRKLIIYVPSDVQSAEGAAAVNLATSVIAHYGTASVAVQTRALAPGADAPSDAAGSLERQIVIKRGAVAGASLRAGPGGPYLLIGGTDDQLVAQTMLLTSDLAPLAQASAAVAGPLRGAPQLAPDVTTLSALGVADQAAGPAAWPSVAIGVDQTRLGRPSSNVRVQLVGTYTPVPMAAGGRVVVRIGETVIDSWSTQPDGRIDRWVSIPDSMLRRYTELTVTVERGDTGGDCGSIGRTSLNLSASGQVTSAPASGSSSVDFGSLPQGLMPRTQLAWRRADVADVTRAVTLAVGMQRMTTVPLGIDVVPFDQAMSSSDSAIVIAADGDGLGDVPLPVRSQTGGNLKVLDGGTGPTTLTLSPAQRYGSLQVLRTGGRTLLVGSSTGDPAGLDAALNWLEADPTRWSAMTGNAMIQTGDRDPVFVSATTDQSSGAADGSWSAAQIAGLVVGVVVLVGMVVGGLLWSRRRGRRARPDRP